MIVPITGTTLVRDTKSMALINQDKNGLDDYLKKRNLMAIQKQEINTMKADIIDVKNDIQEIKQLLLKMLDKLKEKDEKQLEDLVKVYSVMKPKLAANILNLMDMPILKEIVKRMGKKKAALILAAMDAKKVKDLCQTLAKESQSIS